MSPRSRAKTAQARSCLALKIGQGPVHCGQVLVQDGTAADVVVLLCPAVVPHCEEDAGIYMAEQHNEEQAPHNAQHQEGAWSLNKLQRDLQPHVDLGQTHEANEPHEAEYLGRIKVPRLLDRGALDGALLPADEEGNPGRPRHQEVKNEPRLHVDGRDFGHVCFQFAIHIEARQEREADVNSPVNGGKDTDSKDDIGLGQVEGLHRKIDHIVEEERHPRENPTDSQMGVRIYDELL